MNAKRRHRRRRRRALAAHHSLLRLRRVPFYQALVRFARSSPSLSTAFHEPLFPALVYPPAPPVPDPLPPPFAGWPAPPVPVRSPR